MMASWFDSDDNMFDIGRRRSTFSNNNHDQDDDYLQQLACDSGVRLRHDIVSGSRVFWLQTTPYELVS